MKPRTRDNLIYLAVGISIAAFVWIDFFYADSHGKEMWMPSRFAFRTVTTPALLAYFVIKEMLRRKARFLGVFSAVLFATLVQLAIMFGFRQLIEKLPGISYSALTVLEMLLVWQLAVYVTLHLSWTRQ